MKRILIALIFIVLIPSSAIAGPQVASGTSASVIIDNARNKLNWIFQSGNTEVIGQDSQMLQWLNAGMKDMSEKAYCLQSTQTISAVTGQLEYTISGTTYIKIIAARYIDNNQVEKGLSQGEMSEVGRLPEDKKPAAQREPVKYYEFQGKVGFYPALASVTGVTPATFRIYVNDDPADIALTDNVTTPAIYDDALTIYIAAQGAMKDKKPTVSQALMNEYYMKLQFLSGIEIKREQEKAKVQ